MSRRRWPILTVSALGLVALSFLSLGVVAQPPKVAPVSKEAQTPEKDSAEPISRTAVRPSMKRLKGHAGFTPEEKRRIEDNCQFGLPEVRPGADIGPAKMIVRKEYVLAHSSELKVPFWVCEHALPNELVGPADRDNSSFLPDPVLAGLPRAELKDYRGSGFDRGHMSPAANQKQSQSMMDETFFLSNMIPQHGPTFNQGIWAELESATRDWTRLRGECWIISGPMFYDPLEEDESTADGLVPYEVVGPGEVGVPTHCFKIVLSKKGKDWESIAFVFANARHAKPHRLELHLTTVNWIEERTGLDFFPELSTPAQLELMNRLESGKSSLWERN